MNIVLVKILYDSKIDYCVKSYTLSSTAVMYIHTSTYHTRTCAYTHTHAHTEACTYTFSSSGYFCPMTDLWDLGIYGPLPSTAVAFNWGSCHHQLKNINDSGDPGSSLTLKTIGPLFFWQFNSATQFLIYKMGLSNTVLWLKWFV